jgi:hypothetical protein
MSQSFANGNAYRLSSTSQSISCTTTSTSATNPFANTTFAVRLSVSGTGNTHFRIGDGTQTAVTSDPFLPNTVVERVLVSPGQKIAAITESGTATLIVTECSQ